MKRFEIYDHSSKQPNGVGFNTMYDYSRFLNKKENRKELEWSMGFLFRLKTDGKLYFLRQNW